MGDVCLGFAGLGTMGAPMAGHLLRAGHAVTVWNRTPAKAEPLAAQGANSCESLEQLAEACEVVFTCVGGSDDAREVLYALSQAVDGPRLFVDHSTIEPEAAEEIAGRLRERGHDFVDAPVTGGSVGAERGTLTIFLGGDEAACARVQELAQAYGKRVARVGPSGYGQRMKLANQIAVGGALAGLCESLAFARKAGLDVAQAKELIGSGSGGSWAFENYGPKILNEDWTPGFSVNHQTKDLRYVERTAREIGAQVPFTQTLEQELTRIIEADEGELTTAVLYRRLLGDNA